MDVVRDVWDRSLTSQPASPLWVVVVVGLVAALSVFVPWAWRVTEYVATLAHETGHGLVAMLVGQEISAVHLYSDRSGHVDWVGKTTGPVAVASLAAGYTGPTLFGLGAAALLATHHTVALLWAILIFLCCLVVYVRTWFGLLVILAAAGLVFCISWLLPVQIQSAFGYFVAWFLLLAAPRDVFELWSHPPRQALDVDQLADVTGLPRRLWVGLFSVITLSAVPVGGYWMLR
ncbi:M50 family metallopeptidase [Actinomadura sp. 9N215]|uniref:M50 family metallopeptidase n=1 Tax=Actinomadura sp. 9N215 TaxID=3375150 RepID=UPI00378A3322